MNKIEIIKDIKKNQADINDGTKSATSERAPALEKPDTGKRIQAEIASVRRSSLEEKYGQFHEATIAASGSAAPLIEQMNRIYTMCSGLGVVLRIVAGNPVLEDAFDPEDSSSEPPLSNTAISRLVNMSAAMCEFISDEIDSSAATFNDRGQA
ncbi:hypothetical protein [Massilia eurypsychrophila]|nr:hypothetical protein [Massilia eurypsychrophila]